MAVLKMLHLSSTIKTPVPSPHDKTLFFLLSTGAGKMWAQPTSHKVNYEALMKFRIKGKCYMGGGNFESAHIKYNFLIV